MEISFTLVRKVTCLSAEQPLKASFPMSTYLLVIRTFSRAVQPWKVPFSIVASSAMLFREVQSLKDSLPSVRVLDGLPSVTLLRLLHPAKALEPIFVTSAGIVSCFSSLRPMNTSCSMATTV